MQRHTRQGTAIREIVQQSERPLTASEIHRRAIGKLPNLGLATTYRHLRKLESENLLVGVDYPGQPTRYEWADGEQKIHFGCRSCEKLFAVEEGDDFKEPKPPKLPHGYQVKGGEWILYGTCPACSSSQGSVTPSNS